GDQDRYDAREGCRDADALCLPRNEVVVGVAEEAAVDRQAGMVAGPYLVDEGERALLLPRVEPQEQRALCSGCGAQDVRGWRVEPTAEMKVLHHADHAIGTHVGRKALIDDLVERGLW